jgi:RNA polymerase sigma factor (sigma-70 family)
MKRESGITEELFEALLAWLDPDREVAGRKYEVIRVGLIRIFIAKGFSDAEDLADQVINRVMTRLPDIRGSYVGEPVNYFRGVARNLIHEARRRREVATEVFPEHPGQTVAVATDEYDCLLKCLRLLPAEKRELVLDFYLYEKRDKIAHHKSLARQLGITESNLRVRVHRIRETLEKCVLECVRALGMKQMRDSRTLASDG